MRKDTTGILERKVGGVLTNGGMHRQKAYRRIKSMLDGHGFTSPRLYHVVMTEGNVTAPSAAPFLSALKTLCREFRSQGIRYRWRAALERDDEKGLHLHTFILLENEKANPCAIITSNRKTGARFKQPDRTLGKPVRTLGDIMDAQMLAFNIAKPRNQIHRTASGSRPNYASLGSPEKKADCMEWLSYLVKARSKPDDIRGIYFSSRDNRHKTRNIH